MTIARSQPARLALLLAGLLVMAGAMSAAPPFQGAVEMRWSTLAAGGGSGPGASTSAGITVSATIGQHAVGPGGRLTGASGGATYAIVSGYWAIGAGPPGSPCPADLNGDGEVDGADLGILLSQWDREGIADGSADLDGDGLVTGADLGLLLAAWGACP